MAQFSISLWQIIDPDKIRNSQRVFFDISLDSPLRFWTDFIEKIISFTITNPVLTTDASLDMTNLRDAFQDPRFFKILD